MFGTSSMFGTKSFSSGPTTGFGNTFSLGFGSNTGPDGTTIPFEAVRAQDTMVRNGENKDIQTKHMCITAMEQYKMKSIEELRVSDYAANRKGGGMSTNTGGNLFGSTNTQSTGSGLFGNTATQQSSSLFSTQPKPATNSLFGNASTNTGGSLFGNASTNTQGSGLFGNNSNQQPPGGGSLFGTQPKPASSLFSGTTSNTGGNLFGSTGANTQPASGGLFGNAAAQQPSGGSLFNNQAKPATNSLFGGTTPNTGGNLFGNASTNTQPASGGIFGGTATQQPSGGGLFNNQAKPATNSLFGGTTSNTGGSIFGGTGANTQPASGGIFGNTTTQQPAGGGLFNSQAKPASSLFTSTQPSTFGNIASAQPPQVAAQQQAPVQPIYLGGKSEEVALQRTIIESQLSALPYGDSPVFKPKSGPTASISIAKSDDPYVQNQLKKLANQALSPQNSSSTNNSVLNMSNISAAASPNTSFSYKPLVGLPSLSFAPTDGRSTLNLSLHASPQLLSTSKNNSILNDSRKSNGFNPKAFDSSVLKIKRPTRPVFPVETPSQEVSTPQEPRRRSVCFADLPHLTQIIDDNVVEAPSQEVSTPQEPRQSSDMVDFPHVINTSSVVSDEIPELKNLYAEPSLDDLKKTFKDGKYYVQNGLTIGHESYGSVFWDGSFELSTLNFEKIVFFRPREVAVYPDDADKPPLGVDLNRPAEVSLLGVWPFDKDTEEYVKDPSKLAHMQFRSRLERTCRRMDAKFIDYRVSTGTWVFEVKHFSKYGFLDDDDEPMLSPAELEAIQKKKEALLLMSCSPKREDSIAPYPKRQRLDYDLKMDFIETQTDVIPVKEELTVIPPYVRQEIVIRKPSPKIHSIPDEKRLLYRYRNTSGVSRVIVPCRAHWHPSQDYVLLTQSEPNVFQTTKISPVPLLKTYFEKVLDRDGRLNELPEILKNELLRFSPPSKFVEKLDSYILYIKKNTKIDQIEADKEIYDLCSAILISPSTSDYLVEQRKRIEACIKEKLAPYLKAILKNVQDYEPHLATRLIYECLLHGDVKQAVKQAIRFKYFNLSLFLSLYICPNAPQCEEAFAKQYEDMERIFQSCPEKDQYLMKIYKLFSAPTDFYSYFNVLLYHVKH